MMKILFSMSHPGYVRNFESTLRLLADRGHDVHLVFDRRKAGHTGQERLVEDLATTYPALTHSQLKRGEDPTGWVPVRRRVRLGVDYLRYLEPRYRDAHKLRERAEARVPERVLKVTSHRLMRSGAALGAMKGALGSLERSLPLDPVVTEYIASHDPDLVLVTPLVELGSAQADYIRSAHALGISTGLCVFSWDNLTNKGLMHDVPDVVTVWNDAQAREAAELHGVPPERIAVTGAAGYDQWFEWEPALARDEFAAKVGVDPEHPIILYLGSSPFIAPREAAFVMRWLNELRARGDEVSRAGVVIRPHPLSSEDWAGLDLEKLGNAAVWPPVGVNPMNREAKEQYFDSIYHSSAVVGLNTTAQIESAIIGRPVFTPLVPEYRDTQEGTLHFHHLLEVSGGLLHVASALGEHFDQIGAALGSQDESAARSRRFAETFVRPNGLSTPATPQLVAALEEAASRPRRPLGLASPRQKLVSVAFGPFASRTGRYERERQEKIKRDRAKAKAKSGGARGEAPSRDGVRRDGADRARTVTAPDDLDPITEARQAVWELPENDEPIIAGPWSSEVGFELIYWIPFLRWACAERPDIAPRLVVLSRGGVAQWYHDIHSDYHDIFDGATPEQFLSGKAQAAEASGGKQKQMAVSRFDQQLIERSKRLLGVERAAVLHPGTMYRAYKRLSKQQAVPRMLGISRFERMPAPEHVLPDLPSDYVAVRFYFNSVLRDTEPVRMAVAEMVRGLAETTDVVLLNNDMNLDDHVDIVDSTAGGRIHSVASLMRPEDNLHVQTVVVSRATAFLGTYGGLSYLPPLLGVPSLCFYARPDRLHRHHLDVAHRVFDAPEFGDFVSLDIRNAELLRLLAGPLARRGSGGEPVRTS